MKVSLLNPTNFIQLTGQYENDTLGIWAFNSDGQLIGSCDGFSDVNNCFTTTLQTRASCGSFPCEGVATFTSGTDDIAYFYASGYGSNCPTARAGGEPQVAKQRRLATGLPPAVVWCQTRTHGKGAS